MRKALFVVLVIAAIVALAWWVPQWWSRYLQQKSLEEVPGEAMLELQQIERQRDIDSLTAYTGTFMSLERDILTWSDVHRDETTQGVAVTVTEHTGRLSPDVVVVRTLDPDSPEQLPSPDPETGKVTPELQDGLLHIGPESLVPGEIIIVFVPGEQDRDALPEIWKIVAGP